MKRALNTLRLAAARERFGYSQVELAERLGLSRGIVSQWETGARVPSLEVLKLAADTLQVSIDWLLDRDSYSPAQGELGISTAEDIRRDLNAPLGLKDLAGDQALCAALALTPEEWTTLRSLHYRDGLTREGYLGVLMAVRGLSMGVHRRLLRDKPGRAAGKQQSKPGDDPSEASGD